MSNKTLGAVIAILLIALCVVIWRIGRSGNPPKMEDEPKVQSQSNNSQNSNSNNTPPMNSTSSTPSASTPDFTQIKDTGSLQTITLKEGSGTAAAKGDNVSVHYTGWLLSGQKFDSSVDRGTPFSFTLGVGQVIAGWDQGVVGMKVGEKRRLIIPSSLGYGSAAVGSIPSNSTLVFDVDLMAINK